MMFPWQKPDDYSNYPSSTDCNDCSKGHITATGAILPHINQNNPTHN